MSGWGRGVSRGSTRTLAEAAQVQDVQRAETLLYQGANVEEPDAGGNTALHWATWFRQMPLLNLLLEKGADPATANSVGETPVHWAAKSANIEVLKLFTAHKPELLSVKDIDGYTPFVIAAQMDMLATMEWFYLQGVHVDEQDHHGRTALQWASYKGHRKAVQWLLAHQASVGHRDHEKMTALHWAALKGWDQVAEHLIQVGAVRLVFEQDTGGDSALRLARQKKHFGIQLMLIKSSIFYNLFGNPIIFKTIYGVLSLLAILSNWLLFLFVLVPTWVEDPHSLWDAAYWIFFGVASAVMWFRLKLSDPGFLGPNMIEPQYDRIQLSLENPAAEQMEHALGSDQLEMAGHEVHTQTKVHYQQQLIQEARRRAEDEEEGADLRFLDQASFALRPKVEAARAPVALARRQALLNDGKAEYMNLVDEGQSKAVCTICRVVKPLRSHHCHELGRCVSRFDHFCPWVDNAIGRENQRSFVVFLVCLMAVLLSTLGLVFELFVDDIRLSLGVPLLGLGLCFLVSFFNLFFLGFIGLLLIRHVVHSLVNITTFEAIVRPPHIVRRFPKKRYKVCFQDAWFLEGFSAVDALMNLWSFWSLDEKHDMEVYHQEGKGTPRPGSSGYSAMDTEDGNDADEDVEEVQ
jgi:palmitoyltransferase